MKHQYRPSAFSRFLFRSLALSAVLTAGLGCDAGINIRPKVPTFAAQAQFGSASQPQGHTGSNTEYIADPAPVAQAAPAYPSAGGYQQSGGGSVAHAKVIVPAGSLHGRVSEGAPRYYAIDLAVGDSLSFTIYSRKLHNSGVLNVALLEPDSVRLAGQSLYTDGPSSELERDTMKATAKLSGRHILKVEAKSPLEYRIDIITVNQAAAY